MSLIYSKLKKFNESVELNGAWFIKMEQGELPEFDVNDYTEKNIKNTTDRLELKKYCSKCQKHTAHKEKK